MKHFRPALTRNISIALSAFVVSITMPNALAQNLVINGSFESTNFTCEYWFSGGCWASVPVGGSELSGWTVSLSSEDPNQIVDADGAEWVDQPNFAANGNRFVDLANGGWQPPDQYAITTTVSTEPGVSYVLSFAATYGGRLGLQIMGSNSIYTQVLDISEDTVWRWSWLPFTANDFSTTIQFRSYQRSLVVEPGGSGPSVDDISVVPALLQPRLAIGLSTDQQEVLLSWSAAFPHFRPETSLAPAGDLWEPVLDAPSRAGSDFVISLSATNNTRFFRLISP